ncbi:glutamate racemase [Chthoniobacter flavus Ellin428]|uniref:Glutamate racemase n=1 Tax=Chthoniobacter flavus Ellin428 TaxID=497964 RepID=B4CY41_9BACT|nr:glutamate racemase [Chthoniobacter flavus]EDY21189.1 glutamate racemase [Chthoniobacter flavus Ellin428]TCO87559.1 glutamate racemase [Chthoniobacter flavus]
MPADFFPNASSPISCPVGVYDSGYGGLTVLRQLRRTLPELDYIYLGDSGRAPYGGRDVDTILDFAEQCVERLFAEGCRVVVVACHTVSCVALRHLQHRYGSAERRILGVTIPAAEAAVNRTRGHIGFVGTARTVASHTFRTEVRKLNAEVKVTEVPAPLLAPIVEEGWEDTEIARLAVQRYLAMFDGVDTLVLGCTHYPLLEREFQELTPAPVQVLNPAPEVAERFRAWRERHPGFAPAGSGRLRFLSSGDAARFAKHGARFLGEPISVVEHIAEQNGRLASSPEDSEPVGQVVR